MVEAPAMDPFDPIIEMRRVTFAHPERPAVLRDLNLRLRKGDRAGLVAPNGSGKSTLFHLVMGLIKPQSGESHVFGKPVREEKDFIEVRRRVGLLFQDSDDQLFSPTVIEDVAFGPLNLGLGRVKALERAEKTLSSLNLLSYRDRVTARLSGGEKRLVALATVLSMEPEVLLLDEPTTGLDTETRERITDMLKGLDVTYLIISHNFDFLSHLTDVVFTLDNGRLTRAQTVRIHRHVHAHPMGGVPHEHP